MRPSRPHPHVAIPPSEQPAAAASPWNFVLTPPENRDPNNPWTESGRYPPFIHSPPPSTGRPTHQYTFSSLSGSDRSGSRASSDTSSVQVTRIPFPEPQIFRSSSQKAPRASSSNGSSALTNGHRPFNQTHRSTKSEILLSPAVISGNPDSRASSVTASTYSEGSSPELASQDLDDLEDQTLQSEEGLIRFQNGDLSHNEEQWHLFVPREALQVLSKEDITRQSIIFELIQNERDYVRDLELISDGFIDSLRNVKPITSNGGRLEDFIREVFSNLNQIKEHHELMLQALFERQRDQHPLVTSIADIILDHLLRFIEEYKLYIENYPFAEAQHLSEYRKNPRYRSFIAQCSQDPRMKKREFNSLLIRPVTHLPRIQLLLETMKKHTNPEHEDQASIPIASGVLSQFIKSTERGIENAREKVKYWELCESLVFTHGEGMFKQVLDLYDEHRSLHRAGRLGRKVDKEVGTTWWDLHVALLDHYLLLLKPEKDKRTGNARYYVVSRPIPLEYLRLDSFDKPPDSRKERSTSSDRSLPFPTIQRSKYRPVYPFGIHHVSGKSYVLYADTDEERLKWKRALEDAIMLRKAVVDGNQFFAMNTLSEGFFRPTPSNVVINSRTKYTGKISCVTPLQGNDGRNLIAVGTSNGVYIAVKGTQEFHKVLQLNNVKYMQTLTDYNKFLVQSDQGLHAYSLSIMIRVALREAPPQPLDASAEMLSPRDAEIVFVQVGKVKVNGEVKLTVMFATKGLFGLSVHQYEALPPDTFSPPSSNANSLTSFVQFGEPASIPREATAITSMSSYVGFCVSQGIMVAEPAQLSLTAYKRHVIPNFSEADTDSEIYTLRSKCLAARPLGLVRTTTGEILLVYDDLGCYLNSKGKPTHGQPGRESGYLRWETKATSFASFGPHLLLFSTHYIEIRTINEGRLVQVIEGEDVRLVHAGTRGIFVAKKGQNGVDALVELVETKLIEDVKPLLEIPVVEAEVGMWDEWDM